MTLAEAVLEVASLRMMLRMTPAATRDQREGWPRAELMERPMASARPVAKIWVPRARPPAKRKMVPQSMPTASSHVRVNW